MVDKTISKMQLHELQMSGAHVEFEKRPMVIEQFGELIKQISNMITAQEARAAADLSRSQTQLEVLATLQMLIKKDAGNTKSAPLDLTPLKVILAEIKESNNREPVDYDFKILRTGPGLSPAHTIEARVVRPTLN